MLEYATELTSAERRGRALAAFLNPVPGDSWSLNIGYGPDGCALMAAARWAARFGAHVVMRVPPRDSASRAWVEFAESSRLQGLVASSAISARHQLRTTRSGRDIVVDQIPDAQAAWATPLAAAGRFVAEVSPASPRMGCAECRAIDKKAIGDYGVPGLCLMENAAVASVAVAMDMLGDPGARTVLVAAGGGNNGGDGLAVARGLAGLGVTVEVALLKPRDSLAGDAGVNLALLEVVPQVAIHELVDRPRALAGLANSAVLIVDALLGTGFSGGLSPAFRTAIQSLNMSGKPILALDLPSGLDGDSGMVADTAIRATRTVTFAAVKPGLEQERGPEYAGRLYLGDIGAPRGTGA